MSCIRRLFLLLLLTCSVALGQGPDTAFWEPQLALNYNLGRHVRQRAAIRSRHYLFRENAYQFNTRQADLSLFTEYRSVAAGRWSLGVLYRFRNPFEPENSNELRLTEQFTLNPPGPGLRTGHRFQVEQRLFTQRTIHRLRYRFGLDLPLQGTQTDIGEFYLIGQGEPLVSLARARQPQWDFRVTGIIGLKVSANSQVQLGGEYRWEGIGRNPEKVLFLVSSLIVSL